jgi:hypothetical protein
MTPPVDCLSSGALLMDKKTDPSLTTTCALINRRGNFGSDGCYTIETPHVIFLLQSHKISVFLRRPLLNYVLHAQ